MEGQRLASKGVAFGTLRRMGSREGQRSPLTMRCKLARKVVKAQSALRELHLTDLSKSDLIKRHSWEEASADSASGPGLQQVARSGPEGPQQPSWS